ncbi:5'-nucleotidase C-terminal domain-containing protein [Paracoccus luteus]|uniref:5'-nucleotidase C-terminal domain-containing protein n=1 Tax=Paracoccus luteus TaxID=2508543 RepID=UPI00106F9CB4|nr:5'-nucleotidase C-terminal domain-containing protein [Paracoccus luteus]
MDGSSARPDPTRGISLASGDATPKAAFGAAPRVRLRVMATTDLHMHMLGYDYLRDEPAAGVGLQGLAPLIRRSRAEAGDCLLVDNGDFLQGTPLGDFLASPAEMRRGRTHPAIAAMNALGYDAVTLGNHDFHHGADFLVRTLAGARFGVTCANVRIRGARGLVAPGLILHRSIRADDGAHHPVAIGILGVTPPGSLAVDQAVARRVATECMVAAAAREAARLRADGADLVIALCHSGIHSGTALPMAENAATSVAALPDVDCVVAGHTHMVFPGPGFPDDPAIDAARGTLHGKPAVMAGFWGSHLGIIDLELARKDGRWQVADFQSRAVPAAPAPPLAAPAPAQPVGALPQPDPHALPAAMLRGDAAGQMRRRSPGVAPGGPVAPKCPSGDVIAPILRAHQQTLRRFRRRIAHTESALHSYFSLLGEDRALSLVAMAQRWYLRHSLGRGGLPILSAAAPYRAGGRGGPRHYTDVPPGPLTARDLASVYHFRNRLVAVLVTGAQLVEWLERSASIFRRLRPGTDDQMLIDPDFPSYYFDVIDGISWQIDLTRPGAFDAEGRPRPGGGGRVRDLRRAGQPVAPGERFVLATNSYRLSGCPVFRPLARHLPVTLDDGAMVPDVLHRYVAARRRIAVADRTGWSFAPVPGATALFDTAPEALAHMPALSRARVEPAGDGPAGFARLRLHF